MSNAGATIIIQRTSQYANRIRSMDIFINGQKAGSIRNGEKKEFSVSPGHIDLYAKIDWCKTKPVTVDLQNGQTAVFELGSPLMGWRLLFTLYYALFRTGDWIYLKRTG